MWDFGDKLFAVILVCSVDLGIAGWLLRPLDMPINDPYTNSTYLKYPVEPLHLLHPSPLMYQDYVIWQDAKPVKHFKFNAKIYCWPNDPDHCEAELPPKIELQ